MIGSRDSSCVGSRESAAAQRRGVLAGGSAVVDLVHEKYVIDADAVASWCQAGCTYREESCNRFTPAFAQPLSLGSIHHRDLSHRLHETVEAGGSPDHRFENVVGRRICARRARTGTRGICHALPAVRPLHPRIRPGSTLVTGAYASNEFPVWSHCFCRRVITRGCLVTLPSVTATCTGTDALKGETTYQQPLRGATSTCTGSLCALRQARSCITLTETRLIAVGRIWS